MRSPIISLPLWAAICQGAALPQTLGFPTGSFTLGFPQPTSGPSFTFVVPCFGVPGCTPRTLTIFGRDAEEKMPRTLLEREPQELGPSVSRTNIILPPGPTSDCDTTTTTTTTTSLHKSTTSTSKHHSTSTCDDDEVAKRQVLGSPTRTNLITPTPSTPAWPGSPSTVVVTVTKTETETASPTSSSDCDTSSAPASSSSTAWGRSTSWGDGSTRSAPLLVVPTLHRREGQWDTTTTVYVTATPSSSTTSSKTKKHTTSTSTDWDDYTTTTTYVYKPTSTSSCDWDWDDCEPTTSVSIPHWSPKPTTPTNVFTNTLTLPPLTFTKRDEDAADHSKKKTTKTYPSHRTTLTAGGGGLTITNSATIPRITFTAPVERDASPEPTTTDSADLSGFTGWGWAWPLPRTTTLPDGSITTIMLTPPRMVERDPEPQILWSPTRTEILTPTADPGWPWWSTPTSTPPVVTVTITETETVSKGHHHSTTTTSDDDWSTSTSDDGWGAETTYSPTLIATTITLPPITFTKEKRQQVIQSLTRTMLTVPTVPLPVVTGFTTVRRGLRE